VLDPGHGIGRAASGLSRIAVESSAGYSGFLVSLPVESHDGRWYATDRRDEALMNRSSVMILAFGLVFGIAIGLMLNPLVGGQERVQVALWLEVVHRVSTGIGGLGTFVALIIC
jgi:hypothetical protein